MAKVIEDGTSTLLRQGIDTVTPRGLGSLLIFTSLPPRGRFTMSKQVPSSIPVYHALPELEIRRIAPSVHLG